MPDNCTLPIASALAGAAKKLRAFAYVPTIADTVEAALAYRENFSSRELMPIHGDWTAWDTAANASIKLDACLKAAAMRAFIDKEIGWHKTLSNVGVTGVDGMTKALNRSARPRHRSRPAQRQRDHRPHPVRWFPVLG